MRQYDFPNTGGGSGGDTLAASGLAWAPDASKLFAVSYNASDVYSLRVLDNPAKADTTLTASAPATAPRAKALSVTGKLTSNAAFPSGTTVSVRRTDAESPSGRLLGTATVGADGSYSFADTPPAGGQVTYTVGYAGDEYHASATATSTVNVTKTTAALTLDNNGKVYAYNTQVKFTAHLGTTYKNRTVEIYADPYGGDKPNKLIKSGTVDASGNLSASVYLTRDTKLTAKFTGDTRYAPATVTSTVGARVRVSTALSGYYTTRTAWNQTYRYFHKSKDPVFDTTMTPYPNRKYRVEVQGYYDGAWRGTHSEYLVLGSAGQDTLELTGTPPTGVRFRIRSSYIDTTSGDNVNSTTYGTWKYFTFTS